MHSNGIVKVVTPLGGGNSEVILFAGVAAVLAATASDPALLSIFNPTVAI
jgi:hypothetical protein